jgi:lysophospholipase L1-like esterase
VLVLTIVGAIGASIPIQMAVGVEAGREHGPASYVPLVVAPSATAGSAAVWSSSPVHADPTTVDAGSSADPVTGWSSRVAPLSGAAGQPPALEVPGESSSRARRADKRPVLPIGAAGRSVRAVFLGDSYTTGWNGYGLGARGWPTIVGRALGWRVINLAVAGTGFVNPGWTNQPLATRIASAIRAKPQVLVVATGHNDRRFGASAAAAASHRDLARLRRALPNALILVIAPIWADGRPPASLLGLRNALKREAATIGALFLDPLSGGWFAGPSHRLIGGDGIHPTNAGHRHIAELVLAFLHRRTRSASVPGIGAM